ncbi:MAG: 16S rRNA (uracil(1498)-N(3))-methyltransferase [Anaerosomatales bacterium]|nr:16S rRNA (uracil(1498)-N(3))-methyltransferase [Anaerosomatales bacterium]
MALHRFFCEGPLPAESGTLSLSAADIHHVRDVLRLAPGDEVVCVGADGIAARVRLTLVAETIEGTVLGELPPARLPRVTLVQGVGKGEKMDAVVRQCTEIGVERIVPLTSSRTVVRLDARKAEARRERWQRIAAEAAKQAQRDAVPEVAAVSTLADVAAELGRHALALVCWEDAEAEGVRAAIARHAPAPGASVAVVVGPEGGLSAEEVDALIDAGAVPVSLGPTILRTETAGVVASALVIHELGGLGGEPRA